ncbi:hypothetical protein H0H81_002949 [Sphagnurus paluster]|uniref:Mitochondrial intermembrane space import and assembly protein 40 n=1 Tax=Sphagnurus paluster TaxID=117069 RepID=A0A9P7G2N4_9AGAR|nr:hypothetical protein H0H81_002949 [Sphagnurus paluster]
MASLHPPRSHPRHRPHRSQTDLPAHPTLPRRTPHRSATYPDEAPWQHMAHTYTWVVEHEYITLEKRDRKTEQWILEQQMFLAAEGGDRVPLRGPSAQQKIWEEMVYSYEIEAERWMRHEEEARRRAAEREKKTRFLEEEIRRIEARIRYNREAERRKMVEERQRVHEEFKERERRARAKAERLTAEAWRRYEERWASLATSSEPLSFSAIPWPVTTQPAKPENMKPAAIIQFLFSNLHSENLTRKERIRAAQLRWHPDRFQRTLAKVVDQDKALVEEGAGVVARCLNDMMARETAAARQSINRVRLTVGASAAVAATYLTWRLTSDSHSIALDSATKLPSVQQPAVSSPAEHILFSPPPAYETPASVEPVLEDPAPSKASDGSQDTSDPPPVNTEGEGSPDAGAGGAFNPVTGEINWDCPCLGGMAHGPCGLQFREAFSCFVFSEEEPKGINCVEKFKAMQDCFREHPDVYGDEIMDDDDDDEAAPAPVAVDAAVQPSSTPTRDEAMTLESVPEAENLEPQKEQPSKTTV